MKKTNEKKGYCMKLVDGMEIRLTREETSRVTKILEGEEPFVDVKGCRILRTAVVGLFPESRWVDAKSAGMVLGEDKTVSEHGSKGAEKTRRMIHEKSSIKKGDPDDAMKKMREAYEKKKA